MCGGTPSPRFYCVLTPPPPHLGVGVVIIHKNWNILLIEMSKIVKYTFFITSPLIKWPGYGQTRLAIAQNAWWYTLSKILMCANPSSPLLGAGGGQIP